MTTTATNPQSEGEDFTTSEGLRALLVRLHEAGPGAWQHDSIAAALMEHTARKYVPLARRHGLDPWEAATAAFDEMRRKGAREADDAWAYVTHGVRVTCIFCRGTSAGPDVFGAPGAPPAHLGVSRPGAFL